MSIKIPHLHSDGLYDWKQYPIFNLNFSDIANDNADVLKLSLEDKIEEISNSYSLSLRGPALKNRLSNLIKDMTKLGKNYAINIVVLIDEYDAPIVNLPKGSDLEQENIKVMKDFFMTLKSLNSYFKLTFITGVSKFSLSDVFSGANHLDDITIDQSADAMFGYTEGEIRSYFSDDIEKVRCQWSKDKGKDITTPEVLKPMQSRYNGYKFYKKGASVYNHWSTLKFLKSRELSNYWYESGNPQILLNQMSQDPKRFELEDPHHIPAQEHELMYSGSRSGISLKSLMFQTGYLTIASFDSEKEEYILHPVQDAVFNTQTE